MRSKMKSSGGSRRTSLRTITRIRSNVSFTRRGRNTARDCCSPQNQVGKTFAGAMEVAIHATGRYDPEWSGHRFDHPVRIWVCGELNEVVRETIQRLLLGEPGYHGTGTIPKDALLEIVPARGTPELVDTIRVRHSCGDSCTIGLKSYCQGRERFQGATLDLPGAMKNRRAMYFTKS